VALFENYIKPVIGEMPIRQVRPFNLEKIKKDILDKGRRPRTVEYALAVVRQIFNYARNHDLFDGANPTSKVKKPKADNRRIRFLSHDEAETLLKTLSQKNPDLHDMALLALHCGPRAGEIFGLTWKDIDFDRGLVTLRHTKNGHVRHVPMTDRVKNMLKARELIRDNNLVFPSRKGERRTEVSNSFERIVRDIGWNEGISDSRQKVVFHSLRHTCASWLVMAGVPLFTVKEYLGHRQISQTERYSHLAPDSLQQATAALNGIGKEKKEGKVINLNQ
jgi:integrase